MFILRIGSHFILTDSSEYSDDSPFLLASFPNDEAVKKATIFTPAHIVDMFQSGTDQICVQIVVQGIFLARVVRRTAKAPRIVYTSVLCSME